MSRLGFNKRVIIADTVHCVLAQGLGGLDITACGLAFRHEASFTHEPVTAIAAFIRKGGRLGEPVLNGTGVTCMGCIAEGD